MEASDSDIQWLFIDTQEAHRTIRASNKLTAAMYNVKECAYHLKLLVVTRWNSVCDMLESHIKAMKEIQEVDEALPDRVDNRTLDQVFLGGTKKHEA